MSYRTGVISFAGAVLLVVCVSVSPAMAQEGWSLGYPFGKYPGSIYVGGTSGLSGIDSVRALIDSMYFAKWAEGFDPDYGSVWHSVIYGEDDRQDIYTVTDPDLLHLAQATCVIISSSEFSSNGDGTYTLSPTAWTQQGGLPLCEGERFAGQLQIGNCSGFLVAGDIIVTAGHCLSTCGDWGFLFGYQQTDALTPPSLVVSEDDVYFCSEILDWAYAGDNDHCVVRLDRPVVGRTPVPIRRSGLVPDGAPLVVVGHPNVLPMKVAGGAWVQDNRGSTPWFQANTDTYGGNSGSMVVNTDTWEVEGILVRGAPDFVYDGGCAASLVVPNSGNPGPGLQFEEISKTGTVAHLIPVLVTSEGELHPSATLYACADQVGVELRDADLASLGSYDLLVITAAADSELVALTETAAGSGIFTGAIDTQTGTVSKFDGWLQTAHADAITFVYEDDDDGTGAPATVTETSDVDCEPPIISDVTVTDVGVTWASVTFTTGEMADGRLWGGTLCGDYTISADGCLATSHELTIHSLQPETAYSLMIEATDPVGNQTQDDNGGACYGFSTAMQADFFSERFVLGCDLEGSTLVLRPNGSTNFYEACRHPAAGFPSGEGYYSIQLGDDDFQAVTLTGDEEVFLYGTGYSTVYVGSNGYVTFGEGDTDWSESLEEHLAWPPRISVFWDDLAPQLGGRVSYSQLPDRLAVTWSNVPKVASTLHVSAQLHLFFDGTVSVTHLADQPNAGVVGLSAGTGMTVDFLESDLSDYPPCDLIICYYDADSDSFGAEEDIGHYESGPLCLAGASESNLDCDDTEATVYPGAPEIEDDAVDQDCNGVDATCCVDPVGDANNDGGARPTIGDITTLIDILFVSGGQPDCYQEADVNQSGGRYPVHEDITIGDITALIDYLFVSGGLLNDCL